MSRLYYVLEQLILAELLKLKSPILRREVADDMQELRQVLTRILGNIELDKGV